MNKILVWDLPARLFHLAFAGSVSAAIGIGFLVDDDDPLFQMHMIFGIIALFLLVIRLVMGVAGSRYSRFSSLPLRPREVAGYLISAVFSKTKRYAGNNPGSALAAVIMFLLVPALFITGSNGEKFEELHETFAWALLVVVALHLAGLAWHTIRHRENISLAMVTGKKAGNVEDSISSAHPVWAVLLVILAGGWISALIAGHNARRSTVRLPGIGVTVQLGENESGERKHAHEHRRNRHHD